MKRGYARVSTLDQDLGRQIAALQAAGCEKVYHDKFSGKHESRPDLDAMLADLQPGDIVVIQKLDRLGRSLQHLHKLVRIFEEKQVGFISLSDSFNTTTPQGRLVFNILGSIAEFERDLCVERTKNGLAYRKQQGVKLGRKSKVKDPAIIDQVVKDWKASGSIATSAKKAGIDRGIARKILKEAGYIKNF